MAPLKEVMLAPFFKDVNDYDCKVVELSGDISCGDILEVISEHLGVRRKSIALMGVKMRDPVKFHPKESPVPFMQVKGVQSLGDLPTPLKVKPKRRSELTKDEAMQIQEELLEEYSDEVFVLRMMEARRKCRQKWAGDELNTKDYNELMKPILESAQEKVLPKWGYDATPQGMLFMQGHFAPWDPEPDVFAKVSLINSKIGFDYTWIAEEEAPARSRNFGEGGKLKLLFLYGGGCNSSVAKIQCANVFKETAMYRNLEFVVLDAPHEGKLSWHGNPLMQNQLRPFGDTIYLYFDRVPHSGSQFENWEDIEDTFQAIKSHFKRKGPYDGIVGFDMGGDVLLQVAKMAQEGVPGFKDMFRFMVLFTCSLPRELSDLERPKEPLKFPTFISWSDSDENHHYTQFEEAALHIAPEAREIVYHNFGHMPPRLSKVQTPDHVTRLNHFLDAMWSGSAWAPTKHKDNEWASAIYLPMARIQPELIPRGTRRRLLVVHDPMGAHEYESRVRLFEDSIAKGQSPEAVDTVAFKSQGICDRLGSSKMSQVICTLAAADFKDAAFAGLSVEAVKFTDKQKAHDWHCKNDEVNGCYVKEDIINNDDFEALSMEWAAELLQQVTLDAGDRISIVGLGTGAFIAFAIAKLLALRAKDSADGRPAGLLVVDPPVVLPKATMAQTGVLGACPVSILTHSKSMAGPPWRYEVSTRAPVSFFTFSSTEEMTRIVMRECRSTYDDGEEAWQVAQEVGARKEAEDASRKAAAERREKARKEAEEKARKDAEEKAKRRAAEEAARKEAEERAFREAEERAKREAEEYAKRQAAEQARYEAFEKAKKAIEEAAFSASPTDLLKLRIEERCATELAKEPVNWMPVSMEQLQAGHETKAPGMIYGMEFPWSAETLQHMGPFWLTKAFHAAGSLPQDNKVTAIRNIRYFVGGGNCSKLLFEVQYEHPSDDLHTRLFAKIPYPLAGKTLSDRMSSSVMQQGGDLREINTYRLLESRFPFRIPRYYFGDVSNQTTNWILITERIPFGEKDGENSLDPAYDKMKDWELKGPLDEYYFLLVRLGARMAAAYKSEALAPLDVLHQFFESGVRGPEMWGVRPEGSGLGDSEFKAKIKMGVDFVENTGKVLFPEACKTPEFIKLYKTALATVNAYTSEVMWWNHRNPDYVAFIHGNLNVDNMWWWRKPDHTLEAGVLDWGGAGCLSIGNQLWWWLYCCEYAFLKDSLDELLGTFVEEYHLHGGPQLDKAELRMQFTLAAMSQGVGLLGAVPQIYRMCPKKVWPEIKDSTDVRISANVDGKNTLRVYIGTFINICSMIQEWSIVPQLERWTGEVSSAAGIPKKSVAVP